MRHFLTLFACLVLTATTLAACGSDDDTGTQADRSTDAVDTSGTVAGGNQTMYGEFAYDPGNGRIVTNTVKLVVPNEGGEITGNGTILTRTSYADTQRNCTWSYKTRIEVDITGNWDGTSWQDIVDDAEVGDADSADELLDEVLDTVEGGDAASQAADLEMTANLSHEDVTPDEDCTPKVVTPVSTTTAKTAINISDDAIYAIGTIDPAKPSPFVRMPRFTANG